MTYRDSDAATRALIRSLELELAELREAKRLALDRSAEVAELRAELQRAWKRAGDDASLHGLERAEHERAMERIQEARVEVERSRRDRELEAARADAAMARQRAELLHMELSELRAQLTGLEAENAALAGGRERAALYCRGRIAQARASLHAGEAELRRLGEELTRLTERRGETPDVDVAMTLIACRIEDREAHLARLRDDLERLLTSLDLCEVT